MLNEAELRKAELVTEIAEREGELEDVMIDIEDATDRLECLRQRANRVARDVEASTRRCRGSALGRCGKS